jgi:CRP-like cAMP-binding protein
LITWLAINNFRTMRGSRHAWMWLPASVGALLAAISFIVELNAAWAGAAIPAREAELFLFILSFVLAGRLLTGLRGSWRSVSLGLIFIGCMILAAGMLIRSSLMDLNTLAAFVFLGGFLHWNMRPPTQIKAGENSASGTTREMMMVAYQEMRATILAELELDFGSLSRKRVESGEYRPRKTSIGDGEFSRSMTGMTPNDYGSAMALGLDELLAGVERLAGKKYARRTLAYGYDKLHWELQETAEDYILKYVPNASGLSNKLSEDRDDLALLLRSVPLFMGMSDAKVNALSKQFKVRHFNAGDEIVRAGDVGDSFYIVRAGRLEVVGTVDFASPQYKKMEGDQAMIFSTKMRRITQLTRGDYFGEFALIEGKPRAATVKAVTPAEVLRLSKSDFDRLIRSSINFDDHAREEIRRLGMLRQIPLFEGFDGAELKAIVQKLESVKIKPGDSVFEQGDPADRFFIIELGKVSVKIDGQERAVLGTGEYFGEIALLMNTPRTATVTALQPLTLLQLRAADFNQLVQDSTALKQAIERASSRRSLANERWARQQQAA